MNCIQNDDLYIFLRRKAIIFYTVSLFLGFFKALLFIFNILVFCFSTILILLFMFFGYFGVISGKPSLVHADVYIGVIFFSSMLDFLISFFCCYYIYKLAIGNLHYTHIKKVDYYYSYSIFSLVIAFCLLSTIFNIFSIYYTRKFKKLLKSFSKKNEKKNLCLV
ncbi:conserved Plasmodium membrane protein, unknown function [Plasmodium relictum]|uniref:Uncharacterized protein n=1 Tax=Plasmodium relictum TaxID=85471 RepID=A0A1J1HCF4_PLARL|nr:conserved Plasmodium membrane protein, unknown function [Plasmodium relictum]CRH03648.1 conserved Plasmodium membrane protein, unknown function [Plasmodium relictum]